MKSAPLKLAAALLAPCVAGAPVLHGSDKSHGIISAELRPRWWTLSGFESTMIAAGLTGFVSAPIAISASVIGSQSTAISKAVIDRQVANKAVADARAAEAAAAAGAKAQQEAKQSEAQKMKIWLDLLKTLQGKQQPPPPPKGKGNGAQGTGGGASSKDDNTAFPKTEDLIKLAGAVNNGPAKAR